jgi:uridine phosphorylase
MTTPHLTPGKLLGSTILPPAWAAAEVAFVCFTPFPNGLKEYVVESASERYFLHTPNAEVRLCRFDGIPFIVVSEVYGFAVGSTTIEELVHYGIRHIIGVGYVGAFNGAPVGQRFVATATMSDLPLAAHYGVDAYVRCQPTRELSELMDACIKRDSVGWGRYTVWNGNSLYRESPQIVQHMQEQGCDVVNMDTLSVYAVTPVCARDAKRNIGCIYVGTITDSAGDAPDDWQSDLIEAVKREEAHPHDDLLVYMVETVLPKIQQLTSAEEC